MNTKPQILRDVAMQAEARSLRRRRPGVVSSVEPTSMPLASALPLMGSAEPSMPSYGSPEHAVQVHQNPSEAASLHAHAAAEFERGRLAGHEEGVREGLIHMQEQLEHRAEQLAQTLAQEQIQQAQAHFQREANLQIEKLHAQLVPQYELLMSLLRKMPLELERQLADAEDDVVALAFEVICRVIGESAATPEGLIGLVRATARNWHGSSALEIHLHPSDLDVLQTQFKVSEQLAAETLGLGGLQLRWVADSKVAMGGCLLQSSEGALDARLELQLELLRSSLLRTRAQRRRMEVLVAQDGPA